MNANDLIKEVQIAFPGAMRAEIAEAFYLDERQVSDILIKAGMPRRPRSHQRPQSPELVARIRQFANNRLGGKVEIIKIRCERPALCVNGRLVA